MRHVTPAEELVLHMGECVHELLQEADDSLDYKPLRKLELLDLRLKLRRMIDDIREKL